MTVVKDEIRAAIGKELAAAKEAHGPHHSREEQFAVMLEEFEEAKEELEAAEENLCAMFRHIRINHDKHAHEFALRVADAAERLACEAVQLAAVAMKEVEQCRDR